VKGHFTDHELLKTLDCLADLSCNGGGGRHDSGGHDSVVLGPIPRNDMAPAGLCMNKGMLMAGPWLGEAGCLVGLGDRGQVPIAGDYGGSLSNVCIDSVDDTRRVLLDGIPAELTPQWRSALTAARTARFEFGETPSPR
jgi:hypothetical protein